jgi:hypothetical protein
MFYSKNDTYNLHYKIRGIYAYYEDHLLIRFHIMYLLKYIKLHPSSTIQNIRIFIHNIHPLLLK